MIGEHVIVDLLPMTTSATLAFTAVPGAVTVARWLTVTNTTAVAKTFTIWFDSDGPEANTATLRFNATDIAANETLMFEIFWPCRGSLGSTIHVAPSAAGTVAFLITGFSAPG